MKIIAQRTSMPFANRGQDGSPSISPTTQKSVMPFNNVTTIQDILDGTKRMQDILPNAGGSWTEGFEEKAYRETGDDYKREVRDMEILNKMMQPRVQENQKWEVKLKGGTKTFISFDLARKYVKENGLPCISITRKAQQMPLITEQNRLDIISISLNKTFMVESIDASSGTIERGGAFCVKKNQFITCAHVIKKYNKNHNNKDEYFLDTKINLVHGGIRYNAVLMEVDPKLDIALLNCNVDVEPLSIDTEVTIGQDIIAIGSPHGYENNVSTGTIGSLDRQLYHYEGAPKYMFVDLSIFPGNSGGPVIRVNNGSVVGMVMLIVSSASGYGLNAALPSTYIADFCKKNIKNF
jgi:S1-C subfamily serine protease